MADRRFVRVLSAVGDREVAARIASHLAASGFSVDGVDATNGPADAAVVAVLSQRAIAEPDFISQLMLPPGVRVVPVASGILPSEGVPERLAELNWLLWDPQYPERSLGRIVAAIRTNLIEYNTARNVEAAAWAWQAGGREADGLLTRVRDVQTSEQRVQAHVDLTGRQPDPTVKEFLQSSLVRARRLRGKRRRRLALWTVLTLVAASLVVVLINTAAEGGQRYALEMLVLDDLTAQVNPQVQAVKMAALINDPDADPAVKQYAAAQLVAAMSQPWPTAVVGTESQWAVNAAAVYGNATRAWVASGGGSLLNFDIAQNTVVGTVPVSDHLYDAVATPDGATALTADGKDTYLIRGGQVQAVGVAADVGAGTGSLAIATDGNAGAVASPDGVLVGLDLSGSAPQQTHSSNWDSILDVQPAAGGGILALTRSGDTLNVVDPASGTTTWQQTFTPDTLESGSVGGNGAVVVAVRHQLWWSDGVGPLTGTGQFTPDIVTAMTLTDDGQVYFSGTATGTRGYDVPLRVPLPAICREHDYVQTLTTAGNTIVCGGYSGFSLWSAAAVSGPLTPQAPSTSSPSDLLDLTTTTDGLVRLTTRASTGDTVTEVWNPSGASLSGTTHATPPPGNALLRGGVTSWAVSPNGHTAAVGSAAGDVVEFDITAAGTTVLDSSWTAPDLAGVVDLHYEQGQLRVTTATATWHTAGCPGCGADPAAAVSAALQRQMPCYASNLDSIVPESTRAALGVRLCTGSGL